MKIPQCHIKLMGSQMSELLCRLIFKVNFYIFILFIKLKFLPFSFTFFLFSIVSETSVMCVIYERLENMNFLKQINNSVKFHLKFY